MARVIVGFRSGRTIEAHSQYPMQLCQMWQKAIAAAPNAERIYWCAADQPLIIDIFQVESIHVEPEA